MKFVPAITFFVLAVVAASGADFRLSFLDEKPALDDTCQLLRENGFPEDSVATFKKLVEDHNRPGNRVDRTLFPPLRGGYYEFGSFADFTNRVSCGFSETPGDNSLTQNTLMCFDVVCLLLKGAGCDALWLEDHFASKGFVSVQPDGSLTPATYEALHAAIGILSPTNSYELLVGRPRSEAETKMGLSLRAKRRLPLIGTIQQLGGARPPRAQPARDLSEFDAPRVEPFAVRATELNSSSNTVARLADGASARTPEAGVLPNFQSHRSSLDYTNADTQLRSIFATRVRNVKNDGFKFPKNCEVGLGLVVNTRLHYIWGDHAFICILKTGRFICLEKNGPKGPYVRVEFKSKRDLAQYMSWDLLLDAANPKARDYGSLVLISLNDRLIGIFRPATP